MNKVIRYSVIVLAITAFLSGKAQAQEYVLDTVTLAPKRQINDYHMLGLQYGVAFSSASFSPVRNHESIFIPRNFGILYTRYCKMFGYMPYFGFQGGVFYTEEGYKFKTNEKTGYTDCILGAAQAMMKTVEVPILAHFHVDFWKMKIVANLGVYGGYRFAIHRSNYRDDAYYKAYQTYEDSFHPNENQWTFGLKGGGGFAFVFDPIEIHFMATYKYSWGLLHKPNVNSISLEHDDNSKYYYKWGNPTNLIFSVGLHYQITRRQGFTRKVLHQQAAQEAEEMIKQYRDEHPELEPEPQKGLEMPKASELQKGLELPRDPELQKGLELPKEPDIVSDEILPEGRLSRKVPGTEGDM